MNKEASCCSSPIMKKAINIDCIFNLMASGLKLNIYLKLSFEKI